MSRPWHVLIPASAAGAGTAIALASAATSGGAELPALATMALLGSAIGLLAGLLETGLAALGAGLARRLAATAKGRAWVGTALTSVLLSPALAWIAHRAFSGRSARTLPWRDVLVVATTLVLVGVVAFAVRVVLGLLLPSSIEQRTRPPAVVGHGRPCSPSWRWRRSFSMARCWSAGTGSCMAGWRSWRFCSCRSPCC